MRWTPAVCSIGGYEIIFLGADVYYGKDDAVTLFGPIPKRGNPKQWIEKTDRASIPQVAGELPYAYDVLWYDMAVNKAYKLIVREKPAYPLSKFNQDFSGIDELKVVFCIGAQGVAYTYLSNGSERRLVRVDTANEMSLETFKEYLDFDTRHETYVQEHGLDYEAVVENNIQLMKSIELAPKVQMNIITVGETQSAFVKLHDISKQTSVYSVRSDRSQFQHRFPEVVVIYDAGKNFSSRIDLQAEFEAYAHMENLVLTVTADLSKKESHIAIHQNNVLIYSQIK